MDAGLKPYERMKDSGVEWLGEVPEHWRVRRLRNTAKVLFSNVDKHSKDDEIAVRLCNYSDVYHNDRIRSEMSFMRATATADEINRFRLNPGDVLITKDSESWDDIGVPALVQSSASDVICGYHLALLRPISGITTGDFLHRALTCRGVATQLFVRANGVTRFGLSQSAIKSCLLPVPPPAEQTAIARFLEHATVEIESYIRTKEKLIALLDEQKQVVIHDAVTGRIDVRTGKPYPAYKPSGIKWLPNIPAHWETRRSKQAFWPRKELARTEDTQLSATQAWGVIRQDEYEKRIGRKVVRITQHLDKRRHVEIDDFVISMRSFQGGLERARATGCIRSSYVVLCATAEIDFGYFEYLFKSVGYIEALRSTADFIRDGQDLNFDSFCKVDLPFPSVEEQHSVADALKEYVESLSARSEQANLQIALVNEYRTRLIADVVTGKLDVREAIKALLDEVTEANPNP